MNKNAEEEDNFSAFLERINYYMKKFKVFLQSILYVVLLLIINFLTITVVTVAYNLVTHADLNSNLYVENLASFLGKNKLLITGISALILFPVIFKNIKKNKITLKFNSFKEVLFCTILGIVSSLLLNIIMYDLGINSTSQNVNISIISIASTAVLGPIIEEFIFRGIIYNKLKKVFSIKFSIVLESILFAIYHLNLIQGIYALLFGIIITYIYEKRQNIMAPILVHCIGNLTISFIYPLLISVNYIYLQIFLVFLLFIAIFFVINDKNMCISKYISHNINK